MDLFSRARAGDRDALDELLRTHKQRLEELARARMGHELRARIRTSDLLQATYLDVLQSLPSFRGSTDLEFTAWVLRILENNIRDARKYFGARRRSPEEGVRDLALVDESEKSPVPSPSSDATFFDELLLVSRALGRLPEEYRRAILLRMKGDASHRRVARELDRSEGASRVLLSRARAALLVELDRLRSRREGE